MTMSIVSAYIHKPTQQAKILNQHKYINTTYLKRFEHGHESGGALMQHGASHCRQALVLHRVAVAGDADLIAKPAVMSKCT